MSDLHLRLNADNVAESHAPTAEPLLVGAAEAGRLCGRSEASWWRDHAAKRVPAPAWRAPGRTLWSVVELRRWIAAGCPPRKIWEALQANKKEGR